MKNKLLSLLLTLAMMVSMMPAMTLNSYAADQGARKTLIIADDEASFGNIYKDPYQWDKTTKTLHLNDFKSDCSADTISAESTSAVISLPAGSTLDLQGNSEITAGYHDVSGDGSIGLLCRGDLKITGYGNLIIKTIDSPTDYSCGMVAASGDSLKDITITGGMVKINTGSSLKGSYGICARNIYGNKYYDCFDVVAGNSSADSIGIFASENLKLNLNCKMVAKSGNSINGNSIGIKVGEKLELDSEYSFYNPEISSDAGEATNGMSCGISAANIYMNQGKVSTAGNSCGSSATSIGMQGTESINIMGGIIDAKSDSNAAKSFAIAALDNSLEPKTLRVASSDSKVNYVNGQYNTGTVASPDYKDLTHEKGVIDGGVIKAKDPSKFVQLVLRQGYPTRFCDKPITAKNMNDVFDDGMTSYTPAALNPDGSVQKVATLTLKSKEWDSHYPNMDSWEGAAIYADEDLDIIIDGTRKLSFYGSSYLGIREYYGIYCSGNLNIRGNGLLSVEVDDADGRSVGIYADGKLTINGPEIISKAGIAENHIKKCYGLSAGIYGGDSIEISGNTTVVTAEANAVLYEYDSYGILCGGDGSESTTGHDITITGGAKVYGKLKDNSLNRPVDGAYGVYANGNIYVSGENSELIGTTYNPVHTDPARKNCGVYATETIQLENNALLVGEGEKSTSSSKGIYASAMSISSSAEARGIAADAGNTTEKGSSVGVHVNGDANVQYGTLSGKVTTETSSSEESRNKSSYGVDIGGELLANTATITAMGNNALDTSRGLYIEENISSVDSNITATTGEVLEGECLGIYIKTGWQTFMNTKIDASAGASIDGDSIGLYIYSKGGDPGDRHKLVNSDIKATGGSAGGDGKSYGIRVRGGYTLVGTMDINQDSWDYKFAGDDYGIYASGSLELVTPSGESEHKIEISGGSDKIAVFSKENLIIGDADENITSCVWNAKEIKCASGDTTINTLTHKKAGVHVLIKGGDPQPCEITFDVNGHGTAPQSISDATYGSKISVPTAPSCDGCTFEGWYREASCESEWNFDSDVVTNDLTLYAKWAVAHYVVTFDTNGHGAVSQTTADAEHGLTITAPTAPSCEGYTFGGWYKDASCNSEWTFSSDAVTSNITLYAKWTINTYTINFVVSAEGYGTVSQASANADFGTAIEVSGNTLKIGDTTITATPTSNTAQYKYTFVSWSNAPATVSNDATITANFTRTVNKYNVTFDANGHGTAPQSISDVAYGSKIDEPTAPSCDGYTFGGWYKESGCQNIWTFSSDAVHRDTTLYAKWTSNNPGSDPTPAEKYTVPVEAENTVQVEATIEEGKAEVKEITKEVLEEVIKPKEGSKTTDTILIDLSQAKQDVTAVELTSKTVENLAETVASQDNAIEKVTIQMTEATVELDAKTLETVNKEANGDTVKLVVDKTKEEQLKDAQKETLSNYNVKKTFEAYFESNGQRISDFKGGKVVLKIKFTPENGKSSNNYKVWYVGEDGKLEKYASKYENGFLVFTTTHFSDYAIVYEGTNDVLLLKAKTSGSKAIKLSWNGIDNATKYVVYGAKCGNDYKKLKTTTGKSYTVKKISGKKLIAHKAYKFYVVGYDTVGNKVQSRSIHFVTANTQGKYANVKSIKAKYDELLLSVNVTQKIGATYKIYSGKKHIPKSYGTALRYISNNSDVATVTKSGTVKAVGKGTATIYIQDIGGKYCKTKVTVE